MEICTLFRLIPVSEESLNILYNQLSDIVNKQIEMSPVNGNSKNFILTSISKKKLFILVVLLVASYFAFEINLNEEMLLSLHQMEVYITLMHQRDDRKM